MVKIDLIQGFNILTDKLTDTKVGFLVTNKYLYALTILVVTIILAKIILFVVEKYIKRLAKKTKTEVDDQIIQAMNRPSFYIIILLGIYFALVPLGVPERVLGIANNILFSIMTIIGSLAAVVIIDIFINAWGRIWAKKTKSDLDDELLPLLHKTSKVVFFIFAFLFILRIWGINITGFLAGLGIAGIAIGFAVKDSLANVFGGISLILDKTMKVGDRIKLDSGELGEIAEIGIRSTKLRTFDNELLIIPNGLLANQKVQNYTLPNRSLRIKVPFSVEYGNDIDKVKKVVLNEISKIDGLAKDPEPAVIFLEMGDSSLNFQCNLWVDDYNDAYSIKLEATDKIYKILNKAKIGIPFPTRTIYMRKD